MEVNRIAVIRMKLASLEIVRLLKPRLGFGSAEPHVQSILPPATEPEPIPEPVPEIPRIERLDPAQTSLVRLAEQLEASLKVSPPERPAPTEKSGSPTPEARKVSPGQQAWFDI